MHRKIWRAKKDKFFGILECKVTHMQEQIPNELVTVPQIDIVAVFHSIAVFFTNHFPGMVEAFKGVVSFLVVISFPLSIVFLVGIIVSVERLKRIRKKEAAIYDAHVEPATEDSQVPDPELANRWRKIVEEIESTNESSWRQAIVEADIILEDILTKMGYQGAGIGEKLQRVEKADFASLDEAWEAHKVRNRIAHDGSSYALSQYEARRVINLYRKVFEEFYYI